jgi:hypothetical protein
MRSHLCGLVPVAQLFGVKAEIHVFTLSAPPPRLSSIHSFISFFAQNWEIYRMKIILCHQIITKFDITNYIKNNV